MRRLPPTSSNRANCGEIASMWMSFCSTAPVATTQNHYIKTASLDAIAGMRQLSEALICSTCAPDSGVKSKSPVQ